MNSGGANCMYEKIKSEIAQDTRWKNVIESLKNGLSMKIEDYEARCTAD